MNDPATPFVALGAVSSPWWLPSLAAVSEWSATVVPILGAIWLAVQIVRAVKTWPDK